MSRFKGQILLLTLLCIISYSESELGKTCKNPRSCGWSVTPIEKELCVNGICRCNPDYEVLYLSDLEPRCEDIFLSLNIFDKSCEFKTCDENEYCMERPAPYSTIDGYAKQIKCMCRPGFLRINYDCREGPEQINFQGSNTKVQYHSLQLKAKKLKISLEEDRYTVYITYLSYYLIQQRSRKHLRVAMSRRMALLNRVMSMKTAFARMGNVFVLMPTSTYPSSADQKQIELLLQHGGVPGGCQYCHNTELPYTFELRSTERTYFANVTSGKCEPKANYLKAYNLTEYRVKPYEYCYSNSDCISGLECSNYQCDCPGPCKYNETAEICDCGIIEKPPPPGVHAPAIVGVLLSLGIVAFWYRTIKKMIKRYAEKKNASLNEVTATGETHPTYALQPVPPRNESMGTSSPREVAAPSNIPEKQFLLPAETNSDRNAYIPPPQPSQYGFSTPHVSSALPPFSPGAPPPYSLLPSAADSPPPYSLNPQGGSFDDSIPDSSTSSYLPYPYNAATPNPIADVPANPTGSDGPTAPVLNPSSALPYPVSPAISGPTSTSTTLPSAPSYALGSNSASAPKQE